MPTLFIYYKPSAAGKYNIRWKRSTDAVYPAGQSIQQVKTPGLWNNVQVNIPDTDTNWQYEVTSICDNSWGNPTFGTVQAACKTVTFAAEYQHCTCALLNGIITTTA